MTMICPYCEQDLWIPKEHYSTCSGCGYKIAKKATTYKGMSAITIEAKLQKEAYAEIRADMAAKGNNWGLEDLRQAPQANNLQAQLQAQACAASQQSAIYGNQQQASFHDRALYESQQIGICLGGKWI